MSYEDEDEEYNYYIEDMVYDDLIDTLWKFIQKEIYLTLLVEVDAILETKVSQYFEIEIIEGLDGTTNILNNWLEDYNKHDW